MSKHSFPQKERLKKNKSIKDVFNRGTLFKGRFANLYLLKRRNGACNRVAFIIPKNLYDKKIVLRNRFRRVLREAYRKTRYLLPDFYDIIILARNVKRDTSPSLLEEDIGNVFKKSAKK